MKEEAQLLFQVKGYLNAKGFYHFRINTGLIANPKGRFYRSALPGTPDVVCCISGRFIGIETKGPKGKQSFYQKQHEDWIKKNNGEYWLIRNLDELITRIDQFIKSLT